MVNGMALLLVVVVVTQFLGSHVKRKKERKFRQERMFLSLTILLSFKLYKFWKRKTTILGGEKKNKAEKKISLKEEGKGRKKFHLSLLLFSDLLFLLKSFIRRNASSHRFERTMYQERVIRRRARTRYVCHFVANL